MLPIERPELACVLLFKEGFSILIRRNTKFLSGHTAHVLYERIFNS